MGHSGENAIRDRGAGVMLGLACGDALGAQYEFGWAQYDPERGPELLGRAPGGHASVAWTDDTEMAICIARVAASGVPIDSPEGLDEIARGFLGWLDDGPTGIGLQTRRVLGALAADDRGPGIAARMAAVASQLHAETGRTAGNGALMRTAPVALAFLDDAPRVAAAARKIAELTHTDPLAGDSCVLWCEAIRRSVAEGVRAVPDEAALALLPEERRTHWTALLDGSWSAGAPCSLAPNRFTVTAFYAALWAATRSLEARASSTCGLEACGSPVRGHESCGSAEDATEGALYRAGIGEAIALGDDTDTIAAIAGSLLGAWVGVEGIPAEYRAAVRGWPGYRADDLAHLGREICVTEREALPEPVKRARLVTKYE